MFKITILKINKIEKDHFFEDFSVAMTSQFLNTYKSNRVCSISVVNLSLGSVSRFYLISDVNLLPYYVNRFCQQNGSRMGPQLMSIC